MLQKRTSSATDYKILSATQDDYDLITNFHNQNIQLHRHLDWFNTFDWLGKEPFLIEKSNKKIQAILCATPENKEIAWVRTFGVQDKQSAEETWHRLLSKATQKLQIIGVHSLAALAMHTWFENLLIKFGFNNQQNIVVLEWQGNLPKKQKIDCGIRFRPLQIEDLPEVQHIDQLAFPHLWQNSLAGLTKAIQQKGIHTVAIKDDKILGYQISTTMTIYGHLARLAVSPEYQQQGIAYSLVYDLLNNFKRQGLWRITVNTQSDNTPSLNLYNKFGFKRTQEEIPVYLLQL